MKGSIVIQMTPHQYASILVGDLGTLMHILYFILLYITY